MVEIDSQEKHDEIARHIDVDLGERTNYFWIGATDEAVEGSWVWRTTGRPVVSTYQEPGKAVMSTYWAAGQPGDSVQSQNCVVFGLDKWQDLECSGATWASASRRGAICEIGENRLG